MTEQFATKLATLKAGAKPDEDAATKHTEGESEPK